MPTKDRDEKDKNGGFGLTIFTLFPEIFPGPLGHSITGRALEKGLWHYKAVQIRDYANDRHKTVDDTPFGGGAGMVMRPDVLDLALSENHKPDQPLWLMSPRGEPFSQALAEETAKHSGLSLICGRYEGIDQRVIEKWQMREVSLGDFVMTGGELAALAISDAIIRLRDDVVGSALSLEEESFTSGLIEYHHYTRPAEWDGRHVPDILRSGNHEQIKKWRKQQSQDLTKRLRPDLWQAYLEKDK